MSGILTFSVSNFVVHCHFAYSNAMNSALVCNILHINENVQVLSSLVRSGRERKLTRVFVLNLIKSKRIMHVTTS